MATHKPKKHHHHEPKTPVLIPHQVFDHGDLDRPTPTYGGPYAPGCNGNPEVNQPPQSPGQ